MGCQPFGLSRRRLIIIAAAGAAAVVPGWAQDAFPKKAIRLVVPYPPGGTTDVQARTLAQRLQDETRTTVIVENHAGAGGNIGVDFVLKAPADGTTVGITAMNSFA